MSCALSVIKSWLLFFYRRACYVIIQGSNRDPSFLLHNVRPLSFLAFFHPPILRNCSFLQINSMRRFVETLQNKNIKTKKHCMYIVNFFLVLSKVTVVGNRVAIVK